MKLVICGRGWFGEETFRLVQSLGHAVTLITAPARPGRADRLWAAAEFAGIPVVEAGAFRSGHIPEGTELIVAAHASHFISRPARLATQLGAIGYHPSLLPLHRGRDAVRWAVHGRERVTGGTVFWLTDGVDAGPIAAQEHAFVHPRDDARSLWERELGPLGLRLIARVLADIDSGRLVRIPQNEHLATWEPAFGALPLHRPELPQLGAIQGYEVVAVQGVPRTASRHRL